MKRIIVMILCFVFGCIGALIRDLTNLETLGFVFFIFSGIGLFWVFAVTVGNLENDL